jgi:YVTN family beta-propeller protein
MRWTKGVGAGLLALLPAGAWAQPYAFVASAASDSIAVLDLGQDVLLGSFPLAGFPAGSALTPDGTRLFVALTTANALASINTATGAVTLVPVGVAPMGVATDGAFAYVASTTGDRVSVINVTTGALVTTVPGGGAPFAVALGNGRLYVSNPGRNRVTVYDTQAAMAFRGFASVGWVPAGLALDAAASRLYVANFLDNTVSVVDTTTLAVIATIPVVERPRGLALAGGRLYVTGFQHGDIQAIDTATNQVVLQGTTGGVNPVDVAVGPGGGRLYVVHAYVGKPVTVLDAASFAPLTAIESPPGPLTIAGFGLQAPPVSPGTLRFAALHSGGSLARTQRRISQAAPSLDGGLPPWELLDGEMFFWQEENPVGSQHSERLTTGGNPGEWRRTTHLGAGSADHVQGHNFYTNSNAVESIEASWDRRVFTETEGVEESFVIRQSGVFFRTAPTFAANPIWQPHNLIGLTAADFDDGKGGHPDFGPSADWLYFGYAVLYDGALTLAYGVDNVHVVVHKVTPPVVPGILRFEDFGLDIHPFQAYSVTAQRFDGTDNPVSAQVVLTCPLAQVSPGVVSWPAGNGADETVQISCQQGPAHGSEVYTLSLRNPTGGAQLDPDRARISVTVASPTDPLELSPLTDVIQMFLSGFSPLSILALAGPAALLWARRRDR